MSYTEKCNPNVDFNLNPYKDDKNLIIIKVSDDVLYCFSRFEMRQIVDTYRTYDIDEKGNKVFKYPIIERSEEDVPSLDPLLDSKILSIINDEYKIKRNNPENWFYSLRGFCYVDHTLKDCFDQRVNTMKLELISNKPKNLFTIDDASSLKILTPVYRVVPMNRCDLYEVDKRSDCYDSSIHNHDFFNDSNEITEVIEQKLELDPLFNQKLIEQQNQRNALREVQERKQKEVKDINLDRGDLGIPKIEIDGEYKTVTWFDDNNIMKMRRWFKNNVLHRDDDRPAEIEIVNIPDEDDDESDDDIEQKTIKVTKEKWYRDGVFFRDNDLPAFIIRQIKNNKIKIIFACWYKNGMIHRDGDNYAMYINCSFDLYKELNILEIQGHFKSYQKVWYKNNRIYREDDKAPIVSFSTDFKNKIFSKRWIQKRPNNKPIQIDYDLSGHITDKSWRMDMLDFGGGEDENSIYVSEPGKPSSIQYYNNHLIKEKNFKARELEEENELDEKEDKYQGKFKLGTINFDEKGHVESVDFYDRKFHIEYVFYETKQLKSYLIGKAGRNFIIIKDRDDGLHFDLFGDPNQPIYMSYREDGSLYILSKYIRDGKENILETTKFYPSGNIFMRYWSTSFYLHSTNNLYTPALVVYYDTPNNQVMSENWFEDGRVPKIHDKVFMKSYYKDGSIRCIFKTIEENQKFNISISCYNNNGSIVKNKVIPFDEKEMKKRVSRNNVDKGNNVYEFFKLNAENNFNPIKIIEGPKTNPENYGLNIEPSILDSHDHNYWSDDGETEETNDEDANINTLNSYYFRDPVLKIIEEGRRFDNNMEIKEFTDDEQSDEQSDKQSDEDEWYDFELFNDGLRRPALRRHRKSNKKEEAEEELAVEDNNYDDENPFLIPDEGGFYK